MPKTNTPSHAGGKAMQMAKKDDAAPPRNWVAIFSTLSLLAPASYLIGYYYEGGYLRAYGLTQDIFARSTQEYMAASFGALAGLFGIVAQIFEFEAYKKWALICAGIGVFAFAFILYLKWIEWASQRFNLMSKISEHIKTKSTITVILSGTLLLLVPVMLVYALIFLLLPAYAAEALGSKSAHKEMAAFKGCEGAVKSLPDISAPENCVSVYDGDKLIARGQIIAASEKYIALYNGDDSMMMPIKPETRVKRPFRKM